MILTPILRRRSLHPCWKFRPDFWNVNTLTCDGVSARYGHKYLESTRQFFAHSWKCVSQRVTQDSPEGARRFSCCIGMCRRRLELAPFMKVEDLRLARPQTCKTTPCGLLGRTPQFSRLLTPAGKSRIRIKFSTDSPRHGRGVVNEHRF